MDQVLKRRIFLIVALALVLRLFDLLRFPLWVDESATWWYARLAGAGALAEQMRLEPTPPLYYGLIGVLMRIFGESDLVMRLPSVLFGTLSVWLTFVLGCRLAGPRVGLVAGALLAIHPLHIFISREARVYPLLLCLTLWLWLCLWQALEEDMRRAWIKVGAALAFCCYAHFFGLFLALTSGVLLLIFARGKTFWRGALALGVGAGLFLPYLVATLPSLKESRAAWSVESFYRAMPGEKSLLRVAEGQMIGALYHPFHRQIARPETPLLLRWPVVVLQVVLLVAALAWRDRRVVLFLALGWWLPVLVPWTINALGRSIFHSGRHDFFVIANLCLLLALGVARLLEPGDRRSRRALVAAVLVVLALGAAFRIAWLSAQPVGQGPREVGVFLAENAGNQDLVVTMDIWRLMIEHYMTLAGGQAKIQSFPTATDTHPGWSAWIDLLDDPASLARQAAAEVAVLPPEATVFTHPSGDGASVSEEVDGYFYRALIAAGWRLDEARSDLPLRIAAFRKGKEP